MRKEKDALGAMDLPDDALYGIHTARSLDNFGSAGEAVPLSIIYAMVRLKSACARANVALGQLEEDKGRAICTAADKVLSGAHDDQFPIDICQAGSGTSSHMNVNEVLANLACLELGGKPGDRSLVHPNDDVNKGQSTNNVFPSSIRMAATRGALEVISALEALVESLRGKEKEFEDVIKSGRTHLQDAVPITLGQEFSAYARALTKAVARIRKAREKLFELGVGGNAVGTGLNTLPCRLGVAEAH
jgi:fumarate hydratase class II